MKIFSCQGQAIVINFIFTIVFSCFVLFCCRLFSTGSCQKLTRHLLYCYIECKRIVNQLFQLWWIIKKTLYVLVWQTGIKYSRKHTKGNRIPSDLKFLKIIIHSSVKSIYASISELEQVAPEQVFLRDAQGEANQIIFTIQKDFKFCEQEETSTFIRTFCIINYSLDKCVSSLFFNFTF